MPRISSNKHLVWYNELCSKKECHCNKAPLDRTIKNHAYAMAWLAERIDGFDEDELKVPEPEAIMSYLDGAKVTNGRKSNSYAAMKVWHRCHDEQDNRSKYNSHLMECNRCQYNERIEQARNEKESKNWVDYKDFAKIRKIVCSRVCECAKQKKRLWSKQEFTDLNMAFILEYHNKYPLRNELHSVRYSMDPNKEWGPNDNFLDQEKQEVEFRDFKTKQHLGEIRQKLTRKMWRMWRYIVKQHQELNLSDDHIILGKHWKGLSSCGFASYFSSALQEFECCKGKRVTPMIHRKSHITHKLRKQMTLQKHDMYAKNCLHSTRQNHQYRKREL